jgi:Flp pilus assembly protein TadG
MNRALPLLSKWRADERGTAVAELAIIFPFLALLIFGTLETGNIIYQQHVITKGVQEAARFAARSPSLTETPVCPTSSANWPTAVAQAKNLATQGKIAGGSDATLILKNFKASNLTISVSCPSATGFATPNAASGKIPVVVVSASVTAKSLGFLGFVGLPSFTLTASHQEMGIGL